MKPIQKAICAASIALFSVVILIRIFYRIDYPGIFDLDEAWHAVNAYEMYKSNLWTINTYMGEVDYFNSKPPLALIPVIALFHICGGASFFLFKLPSALAGVLHLIILGSFLFVMQKKRGIKNPLLAVTIFTISFLTLDRPYDYHMFRTGNLDSIYNLFLMLGLICLYKAGKKIKWLIPFGACLGLAFLCKSFNVAAIVFTTLFCIPFLAKEKRWRHIIYSVLTATLVVLPWAIKRFAFDGTAFFYQMLFGEGGDKVTWFSAGALQLLAEDLVFRVLYVVLILHVAVLFITDTSSALSRIKKTLRDNDIFWIWFIMPIVFYSIAGTVNPWYIYCSYVVASVLTAIYANDLFNLLGGIKAGQAVSAIAYAALIVVALLNAKTRIDNYALAGTGGGDSNQFRGDMVEIIENHGDEYRGSDLYMQDYYYYNDEKVVDELFCHTLVYAEYFYDFVPKRGGIDAWEQAEDGIIVINKGLWDELSPRLIGHVIVQDNGYMFFSRDMY